MLKSMKRYTLIALAAAGLAGTGMATAGGEDKQRVVYHINDVEQADGALRNINNHLNATGDEKAEIIVVTHGGGAMALVEGSTDSRGNGFGTGIQALANRGVKFQICNNTIEGKGIDRNAIDLNAEVIPSGVAQLAKLQQQGYVYIKP